MSSRTSPLITKSCAVRRMFYTDRGPVPVVLVLAVTV